MPSLAVHTHGRAVVRSLVLAALAGTLCVARPARAADSAAEPDTSYLAGDHEEPGLGLSLDQARRLAAAESPVARSAVAALRSARGVRMRERAAFDPSLALTGERTSADSPSSSAFSGTHLETRTWTGGLTWTSPIGTALGLSLVQNEIQSDAPFSTLPRERDARARLDWSQPLLKGFGLAATRGALRASDRDLEAARRDLEAATLDLNAAVENAYWALYAAERDLGVQRLQRQRAALFLREQNLRARAGIVGPGALAIARTFLAEQEATLLDTRLQLGAAADRLAQTIGVSPGAQARYHCLDEPAEPDAVEPLDVVLARAQRVNPALGAADERARGARERLKRANWNAWPSVDAFGGWGKAGLAGTGRTISFGSSTAGSDFETGFGTAWDQVRDQTYPSWNLGVRMTMPIGWRGERGDRERARGDADRAAEQARAQRLALEVAVRGAHREAELSRRSLAAMQALLEAAREQTRIARLEYQAGRTTAYETVNLEADLARAEFRVSEMLVRVARANSELKRLTTGPAGEPTP